MLVPSSSGDLIPGQEYKEVVEIYFDLTCKVSEIQPLDEMGETLYLDLDMKRLLADSFTYIDIPNFAF